MTTYTPAETVQRSGFSIETLRYYERVGLLGEVGRSASGHRVFTEENLEWLGVLRCLRDTGMPIADMRRFAAYVLADEGGDEAGGEGGDGRGQGNGAESVPECVALLEAHARAVAEHIALLRKQQRRLRQKIADYRARLPPA